MAGRRRGGHHPRMRKHYTSKQRSELVELVTTGQTTMSEAAARLGVTPSTAYYWMKRRRSAGATPSHAAKARQPTGPTFVRLVSSSEVQAAIAVRVGGAEIQIRRDFDGGLLRAVVEALRGGAA
jgi:transposase-like protein